MSDIDSMRLSMGIRHDWQKMIAEVRAMYQCLYGRRLTDYKLGDLMEVGHETIAILSVRGEPRHTAGELLKSLHASLLRQKRCKGDMQRA